ncbi:hypothetical protein [Tumebacillus algifaecis]|uniref:hypothetical protein n=1 Tax=Tumebacillus algifaecis TaxID=1214604 RepID=UPI0012FDD4E4|nr:hypothetical protein [Tumebacillus algifaecis]
MKKFWLSVAIAAVAAFSVQASTAQLASEVDPWSPKASLVASIPDVDPWRGVVQA